MLEKTVATGVVAKKARVFKTKAGVTKARLDVSVDGNVATHWSDDPADAHLFSFVEGDEVEVEYWPSNGYWNCKVLTAYGSASEEEADEAARRSMDLLQNPAADSEFDSIAEELVATYLRVLQMVNSNDHADVLEAFQNPEEIIRAAASSVFIELNRRGYGYNEAFGL
jgi:hypothetical protein